MFGGAAFMLLAALGVIRMPDLFTRLQATTKASTLGVVCLLSAVAIHFDDVAITTRSAMIVGFVFLTAPVSAHVIARAAYLAGVALWHGSVIDELAGRYDPTSDCLRSGLEKDPSATPTPDKAEKDQPPP